jgi:hypothetical protein
LFATIASPYVEPVSIALQMWSFLVTLQGGDTLFNFVIDTLLQPVLLMLYLMQYFPVLGFAVMDRVICYPQFTC